MGQPLKCLFQNVLEKCTVEKRPEGRWISPRHAPSDIFVEDETILIAAQGTLGENEVFC